MESRAVRHDKQRTDEIHALKREYDWLLEFEGQRIFDKVENVLKECCRRLPLPNKVAPYVTIPAGQALGLQPEKFMITSQNSDAVRCVLTLLGDNVVQAEVAIRYAKAPGHIFRSTAQPDVQWKMQQIQDLGNYILKAMESVKGASHIFDNNKSSTHRTGLGCDIRVGGLAGNPVSRRNRILFQYISEVIRDLINARSCLTAPKKRSLVELQGYKHNKLVCAAYVLQDPTSQLSSAAVSRQTFQVMQGECSVQWLSDVLSLLHSALLLSQQFKDKLDMFHEIKELREHIHSSLDENGQKDSDKEHAESEEVLLVHV